nr:MAG TPA: hypothetical protein [Caudoviricetes sp.]DAG22860.1 MAG TPA: hypothetical protein [Caudoviricetes sp.]
MLLSISVKPEEYVLLRNLIVSTIGISLLLRSVQMAELSNLNGLLGLLKIITSMPNGY